MLKTLVKRALRKDASDEEDATSKSISVRTKARSSKRKQSQVLDTTIFHAITKAVVDRRRISSSELCQAFEKYDDNEVGLVTESSFAKGLVKIGIKLKPDQVESLADCFRRRTTKKGGVDIDYYAFVDFAIQERDSDILEQVGDKLRRAIVSYNKKTDRPWNAMDELRRLDKKDRGHILPDALRGFLESNRTLEFELSVKEVSAVVERFEFEDDRGNTIVDYEQFAKWLQPSMHVDLNELHTHVKRLFAKAQDECNVSLKAIFEEIDDDESGHITAKELKDALRNMGLPITDSQIKCLVDDYDVNGDGKIEYSEFTAAFAGKLPKNDSKHKQDDNEDTAEDTPAKTKVKDNPRALIPVATLTQIEKAVVRKNGQRISTKVLCELFEKYDSDERGVLDDATFIKCIGKLGVKLKSDQMKTLVECFRARPTTSTRSKSKTAGRDIVDYYAFADYATNIPDTNKLAAVGDKIRRAISRHEKNARDGAPAFNIGDELRAMDKKHRLWLPSDTVRAYLESSNSPVDFELTSKEVALVVGRFEFEFDTKGTVAVDYDQLATWLQPTLNMDVKQLNDRVSMLIQRAKKQHKLSLKEVFDEFDGDQSGSINRSEFKQAIQAMGLPLTEAQAYCLVDEYDTSGDGRIQYNEFSAAFATKSSADDSSDDGVAKKRKKNATTTKTSNAAASRLIPVAAEEAIAKAVRGKRKLSPTALCEAFERYDKEENGLVDEATFTKVMGKVGIKVKSDHLKRVTDCFRQGKFKKKTNPDIDYYGFVDYATNIPDTDKLAAVGDKMRQAIVQYNKRSSDQHPFNLLDHLQKLDKKAKGWLKPEVFQSFIESNRPIAFDLTEKEGQAIMERFRFDYDDRSSGVDYDQVAKWLQPTLHYNAKELHKHVCRLSTTTDLAM
ncbi:hypothetical protein H310_09027 [Aphanomyces invadans]|uniref:EF-hand domain-containing protein n=1 Tax=Aphanomyces invadans TaxID=157072 RepID=A0A024TXH7_9STRA|nr:hypothetical protein H310_09027 [Aphanomyces invadans]ETV98331.1 hypothetical protein H310_09027 [Aphanomyces invadans]|eukprot:XP_008873206.1 hypothetical protein H310_09027 [Aphanomyces invadans]